MKVKILKNGCRYHGVELSIGQVIDIEADELPPKWKGLAENISASAQGKRSKPPKDEEN